MVPWLINLVSRCGLEIGTSGFTNSWLWKDKESEAPNTE